MIVKTGKGFSMPINPALLICAPMLQDFLIDATGIPMAAGTVTCYQDNSRTTYKNWYYQSGTPGNYTYITLPNPLTLSAAGTIQDAQGNDVLPFYYPYSEIDETQSQPYYIVIQNASQTNIITRANFPYNGSGSGPSPSGEDNFDNYIINNRFWRNIGSMTLTNVLSATVAPSQHDGFRYPDIMFAKNTTGGTDTVTFTQFPLTINPILTDDITPEFYINHACANTPTGETYKHYQFPISLHINTLASVPYTVTIQAQSVSGATGINLYILQDTGTGTTSPMPDYIGSITLNSGWTKYTFTSEFPATAGLTLGAGGDDALYLQVAMPVDAACSINFTLPSIYLSSTIPSNNFATYDEIDSVISTPRTGDVRTSVNSFYPYGWVPMNNGTIGNASSNATARANTDTWQLFNLLWSLADAYDSGSNFNPICQMYTSAGSATNFGTSAYADFIANNQLALTQMLGNVIMGTVPISALTALYNQAVTGSSSSGLLFTLGTAAPANFYIGQPVTFTATSSLPGNIVANAVYYVAVPNSGAGTFKVSTTFANALAGTVVAHSSNGSGVTAIFQTSGSAIGEYDHTMLLNEMVSHTHYSVANNSGTGGSSGSGVLAFTIITPSTQTSAPVGYGSQIPFNVVQQSTLYNIYMKL